MALVIISCSESDPRIDLSRYFNLSAAGTSVVKTAGGRTESAVNSLYAIDQASRIGMAIVVQHTGCSWSPGTVEANIQADVAALKASPYLRNDMPVIGYVLDVATGQLREVSIPRTGQDEAARREVLSQMNNFGPFWC